MFYTIVWLSLCKMNAIMSPKFMLICQVLSYFHRSRLLYLSWRGDALVESTPFDRRVVGSNPALAAAQGLWASPSHALAYALRRETPIQYLRCVGSASKW